jgi:hypothetical protein
MSSLTDGGCETHRNRELGPRRGPLIAGVTGPTTLTAGPGQQVRFYERTDKNRAGVLKAAERELANA